MWTSAEINFAFFHVKKRRVQKGTGPNSFCTVLDIWQTGNPLIKYGDRNQISACAIVFL